MNWEKVNQYYNCSMKVVKFIGVKNILFFGMLGTAISLKYLNVDLVGCWINLRSPITVFTSSRESSQLRPFMSILTDRDLTINHQSQFVLILKNRSIGIIIFCSLFSPAQQKASNFEPFNGLICLACLTLHRLDRCFSLNLESD